MTFTDDDLKQTKEFMADDIAIGTPKLQRLLARLEAAELCAEELLAGHDAHWRDSESVKAWRKTAGR